jgi:hypothetical protein
MTLLTYKDFKPITNLSKDVKKSKPKAAFQRSHLWPHSIAKSEEMQSLQMFQS